MKRFLILFLLMFSFSLSYGAGEKRIVKEELPSVSLEFINRYYNTFEVAYCAIDKSLFKSSEYDVYLSNGIKIEFDNHGYLKSIISPERKGINLFILPVAIRNLIIKNYPNCYVYGYSIDHKGKSYEEHEVYLSNGHKLVFNRYSYLIEVDR